MSNIHLRLSLLLTSLWVCDKQRRSIDRNRLGVLLSCMMGKNEGLASTMATSKWKREVYAVKKDLRLTCMVLKKLLLRFRKRWMETSRHLQINILIETFLEGKYSEVRDNNTKMMTYFQDPRSWQCKRAKTRWDLTIADVAPPRPIHKELKKDLRVLLTWLSDVDSFLCQL